MAANVCDKERGDFRTFFKVHVFNAQCFNWLLFGGEFLSEDENLFGAILLYSLVSSFSPIEALFFHFSINLNKKTHKNKLTINKILNFTALLIICDVTRQTDMDF